MSCTCSGLARLADRRLPMPDIAVSKPDEEARLQAASEFWGISVESLRRMPKHQPDCSLVTTHHLTCTCGATAKAAAGE